MQSILLKHYSEYLHALSIAGVPSKKFPSHQILSLNSAQLSKPGPAAEFCLLFCGCVSVFSLAACDLDSLIGYKHADERFRYDRKLFSVLTFLTVGRLHVVST